MTVGELKDILAQSSAGDETVLRFDTGWPVSVTAETPWVEITHADVTIETPGESFVLLS
jgi:hypothetical protein